LRGKWPEAVRLMQAVDPRTARCLRTTPLQPPAPARERADHRGLAPIFPISNKSPLPDSNPGDVGEASIGFLKSPKTGLPNWEVGPFALDSSHAFLISLANRVDPPGVDRRWVRSFY